MEKLIFIILFFGCQYISIDDQIKFTVVKTEYNSTLKEISINYNIDNQSLEVLTAKIRFSVYNNVFQCIAVKEFIIDSYPGYFDNIVVKIPSDYQGDNSIIKVMYVNKKYN